MKRAVQRTAVAQTVASFQSPEKKKSRDSQRQEDEIIVQMRDLSCSIGPQQQQQQSPIYAQLTRREVLDQMKAIGMKRQEEKQPSLNGIPIQSVVDIMNRVLMAMVGPNRKEQMSEHDQEGMKILTELEMMVLTPMLKPDYHLTDKDRHFLDKEFPMPAVLAQGQQPSLPQLTRREVLEKMKALEMERENKNQPSFTSTPLDAMVDIMNKVLMSMVGPNRKDEMTEHDHEGMKLLTELEMKLLTPMLKPDYHMTDKDRLVLDRPYLLPPALVARVKTVQHKQPIIPVTVHAKTRQDYRELQELGQALADELSQPPPVKKRDLLEVLRSLDKKQLQETGQSISQIKTETVVDLVNDRLLAMLDTNREKISARDLKILNLNTKHMTYILIPMLMPNYDITEDSEFLDTEYHLPPGVKRQRSPMTIEIELMDDGSVPKDKKEMTKDLDHNHLLQNPPTTTAALKEALTMHGIPFTANDNVRSLKKTLLDALKETHPLAKNLDSLTTEELASVYETFTGFQENRRDNLSSILKKVFLDIYPEDPVQGLSTIMELAALKGTKLPKLPGAMRLEKGSSSLNSTSNLLLASQKLWELLHLDLDSGIDGAIAIELNALAKSKPKERSCTKLQASLDKEMFQVGNCVDPRLLLLDMLENLPHSFRNSSGINWQKSTVCGSCSHNQVEAHRHAITIQTDKEIHTSGQLVQPQTSNSPGLACNNCGDMEKVRISLSPVESKEVVILCFDRSSPGNAQKPLSLTEEFELCGKTYQAKAAVCMHGKSMEDPDVHFTSIIREATGTWKIANDDKYLKTVKEGQLPQNGYIFLYEEERNQVLNDTSLRDMDVCQGQSDSKREEELAKSSTVTSNQGKRPERRKCSKLPGPIRLRNENWNICYLNGSANLLVNSEPVWATLNDSSLDLGQKPQMKALLEVAKMKPSTRHCLNLRATLNQNNFPVGAQCDAQEAVCEILDSFPDNFNDQAGILWEEKTACSNCGLEKSEVRNHYVTLRAGPDINSTQKIANHKTLELRPELTCSVETSDDKARKGCGQKGGVSVTTAPIAAKDMFILSYSRAASPMDQHKSVEVMEQISLLEQNYTVRAVICHDGPNPHSGHYFCNIRTSDGTWKEANDMKYIRTFSSKPSHLSKHGVVYLYELSSSNDAIPMEIQENDCQLQDEVSKEDGGNIETAPKQREGSTALDTSTQRVREHRTRAEEARRRQFDSLEQEQMVNQERLREIREEGIDNMNMGGTNVSDLCVDNPLIERAITHMMPAVKEQMTMGPKCSICAEQKFGGSVGKFTKKCEICARDRQEIPKFSAANKMHPAEIPKCMEKLSFIEKKCIRLIRPCLNLYSRKGGGTGIKGSAISVFQDVATFAKKLPPTPEELALIIVEKESHKSTPKTFVANRNTIRDSLLWLKANNPYYEKNLEISGENLLLYPDNSTDPVQGLATIEHFQEPRPPRQQAKAPTAEAGVQAQQPQPDNGNVGEANQDQDDDTEDEEPPIDNSGVAGLPAFQMTEEMMDGDLPAPTSFVPATTNCANNQELIRRAIEQAGKQTADKDALRAMPKFSMPKVQPNSEPASEFMEGFYSMAYPWLFPNGDADFTVIRPTEVTFKVVI